MVGRRKVISSPQRRPILPLTTLPSTFRLPRGSRKGGRASPAMRDAIARARPAASFRRHSLEREGDTASRIRSSPLETLIAPCGTDGSNPASSSGESNFRFLAGTIRQRPSSETTPSHIVMILRMSTIVSSLPGTELTLLLPARELPFRWLPDVPTVPVELQATFGSGGAQRPRPF